MRFQSKLVVHLDRLESNFQKLKKITPSNDILFMVKANAYGHGLLEITEFSNEELNINEFGVASIGEAIYLRENLKNNDFDLYVFSDLDFELDNIREAYVNQRILPVIHTLYDLEIFLSDKSFKHLPLCLKFNTGMNRLGISEKDIEKVLILLKQNGRKSIKHLMSHFGHAFSNVEKNSFTEKQYLKFLDLKKQFRSSGIEIEKTSMACSGAIEQGIALDGETHIRPGLMMYGPSSLSFENKKNPWQGQIISDLNARIINVFKIEKGAAVGYGETKIEKSGMIAVLGIGYGDGFSVKMAGATIRHLKYEGEIIGRINMDMLTILFPLESESSLKINDTVQIWGEDQRDVLSLSTHAGTIPYELFCLINNRVPRVYLAKD